MGSAQHTMYNSAGRKLVGHTFREARNAALQIEGEGGGGGCARALAHILDWKRGKAHGV